MSSVKTELYFRQVLGRVLRMNDSRNQQAWLFTFAEKNLIEFSERVEEDVPESCMFAKMDNVEDICSESTSSVSSILNPPSESNLNNVPQLIWGECSNNTDSLRGVNTVFDELRLGIFKQRVISAFQDHH